MLHKLRNGLGLKVRAYRQAPADVGGTWYWNRYPGALSDTESPHLPILLRQRKCSRLGDWKNRYLECKPDILDYLQAVRRSAMIWAKTSSSEHQHQQSLVFNECASNSWEIQLPIRRRRRPSPHGMSCALWACCRRLICPTSRAAAPSVARWSTPVTGQSDLHDLKGKRVGVIGTGSTGTQIVISCGTRSSPGT